MLKLERINSRITSLLFLLHYTSLPVSDMIYTKMTRHAAKVKLLPSKSVPPPSFFQTQL